LGGRWKRKENGGDSDCGTRNTPNSYRPPHTHALDTYADIDERRLYRG
jgi:hypothetical protein